MSADSNEEIWLLFAEDGGVIRSAPHAFPGAVRFRAAAAPAQALAQAGGDIAGHGSRAVGFRADDPEGGRRMFEQVQIVTENLIREFPDAAEALGLAGARIARLHLEDRTPVARRPAGIVGPMLCAVGLHRLMPLRWITGDRTNRGLVCNRCYRQFPNA